MCCSPWGCIESDITEQLSNNNRPSIYMSVYVSIYQLYLPPCLSTLCIYQLYHLCTQRESQKESPDSTSILSLKKKRFLQKAAMKVISHMSRSLKSPDPPLSLQGQRLFPDFLALFRGGLKDSMVSEHFDLGPSVLDCSPRAVWPAPATPSAHRWWGSLSLGPVLPPGSVPRGGPATPWLHMGRK